MLWLLIGYMFLFIHRPFEIWPILGDIHLERIYMAVVFLAWIVYGDKRWLRNQHHYAYFCFAFTVLVSWLMSNWMEQGQIVVENWFKVIFFYFLFITVVHEEDQLKKFCLAFLGVMAIYMLHSLKEFVGGRHTYRMGIVRLIGVDSSLGDPNSYGASILFSLPFISLFWRTMPSRRMKLILLGYIGLSMGSILLTGSRSSLVCAMVWWAIVIMKTRYRFMALAAAIFIAPLMFFALPESLQNRFETIIDPSVGPKNAQVSGEGRIEGLLTGFRLLGEFPLTGIGPGAWRPATGSEIESHNLYGQLMGELGGLGVITFVWILIGFVVNIRWLRKQSQLIPEWKGEFLIQIGGTVGMGIFLMLLNGNFGHNLFRHNWLWYGGFIIIARYVTEQKIAQAHRAYAQEYVQEQSWQIAYPQNQRNRFSRPIPSSI